MWEVGSVSDSEDDEPGKSHRRPANGTAGAGGEEGEGDENKRKGIGGGNVRGERRGLLVDDEEGEEAESPMESARRVHDMSIVDAERHAFADAPASPSVVGGAREEDGFGDFETVRK